MAIPIIIPLYKEDKKIYSKIKEILKKQTIKAKIIETRNLPEAQSINTGLKKAKSDIVVTLSQDCVPHGEKWLENLIKPLKKDKKVIVTVSDVIVTPYNLWKKFDLIAKALTIKEQTVIRPTLDARGCAYRASVLKSIGYFNEDKNIIGIDDDLYMKLKNKGKIAYPSTRVSHYHFFSGRDRLFLEYKYAKASGALTKKFRSSLNGFWKRLFKATPILGIIPIIIVFPIKRSLFLFLIYLLLAPIVHIIFLTGFWKAFLTYKS